MNLKQFNKRVKAVAEGYNVSLEDIILDVRAFSLDDEKDGKLILGIINKLNKE
tara:strand:+ start:423 stop:581 length:159 start_codon:yes stop_codon:yes gene_type:complete